MENAHIIILVVVQSVRSLTIFLIIIKHNQVGLGIHPRSDNSSSPCARHVYHIYTHVTLNV